MSTVANPVEKRSGVGAKVGWVLTALLALFFLFDAFGKLTKAQAVKDSLPELGIPESIVVSIGAVLLVCTVLYVIPATAFLGAVLLTGYLGGAVFTHMRVESSLFGETLFPVYMGIVMWGALYLRDKRVGSVMPIGR